MTFADVIRSVIRSYILNLLAAEVVNDIATNGLSSQDQVVIDAFLAQTAP